MENFSKKKRGRPKLIDGEAEKTLKALGAPQTRRSFQNHFWKLKAFRLLTEASRVLPGYEYLFGGSNDLNSASANMKQTIISELGRL